MTEYELPPLGNEIMLKIGRCVADNMAADAMSRGHEITGDEVLAVAALDPDGSCARSFYGNVYGAIEWIYNFMVYPELLDELGSRLESALNGPPRCSVCGSDQTQVTDWSSDPMKWRCRRCKHRFTTNPNG